MKFTPETLVNVSSGSSVVMLMEVILLRVGFYFTDTSCPIVSHRQPACVTFSSAHCRRPSRIEAATPASSNAARFSRLFGIQVRRSGDKQRGRTIRRLGGVLHRESLCEHVQ